MSGEIQQSGEELVSAINDNHKSIEAKTIAESNPGSAIDINNSEVVLNDTSDSTSNPTQTDTNSPNISESNISDSKDNGSEIENSIPTQNMDQPDESKTDNDFLDGILEQAKVGSNTLEAEDEESVSSDSSSSSSSSDDEDEDDDDDDDNDHQDIRASDDDEDGNSGQPIISKNEVVDEMAPSLPDDFSIATTDPIEEIGTITGVVDKSLIIKGNISGEFRFLKEDSVLCLEDRTPLGYLFEIFGPLAHPLYRVKFNTDKQLEPFVESKGRKVFYVVPKSNFIYTDSLKLLKGSDASNWNDEEIPEEEQEFSDDEKEMASKKSKNKKKRTKKNSDGDEGSGGVSENTNESGKKLQKQSNQKTSSKSFPRKSVPSTNQNQPNSILGYQSRSQREQPQRSNPTPPSYSNFQQRQVPMFTPPPHMMNPNFVPPPPPPSFPMPGQPPVFPNPNMQFQTPQQWHQFYQMQQFMMQQMFASQQASFTQSQFNNDNNGNNSTQSTSGQPQNKGGPAKD
ncbi:H/ACA ribonucleoprotein complex non-core subunit NAF1 [Wickerhamomyces ciferrii]|uniref:H/ACA ribonucleoprotein complex non-core subunit NAF1 n=1 Tax=Wickerhamomyces ciferrii (strain ATCC 14091 / BCRC 22168 / CBS 111 / JCM 3599 / NBRC 0793 / NRRL Y-1031 F-60-10) TaxID=1206466 RepID=K0KHT6_WICCF|nr:H/ACA ribonucleoprotein complex non-core subunit NAF1 [Wickerhamomyces ciferrii]CCH40954.1 H/ACA ribonucleoprotein complex non-core subunit NAF1 [Wickerhamomyces ciferrii]